VVLELHTYSSLDASFLKEYKNALAKADVGMVFYEPAVLAIKEREPISAEVIKNAFGSAALQIETTPEGLAVFLRDLPLEGTVLLFMSSGNYGGTDFKALAQRIS
jgi:UDP-N-acetylmuramate: L-alanyl-gamma-D-glutamyl-meso-diaminopimelate ligase